MGKNGYLTLREAAELYCLSERAMRQKCIDGKVRGARKTPGGGKWVIPVPKETASADEHQQLQAHWNKLADMARGAAEGFYVRLIGRDFDPLNPSGQRKRPETTPGVRKFFADTVLEILHPLEPFDWRKAFSDETIKATHNRSLITHLDAEFKGFSCKLEDWKKYSLWYEHWRIAGEEAELPFSPSEVEKRLDRVSYELIETLNLVAARPPHFKGTCDICKDW